MKRIPVLARTVGIGANLLALLLPGPAQAQSLDQLLLSSPWCSFSYNQTTGTSRSKRYVFHQDGTYSVGSQAETYNSGRNGTVAGASRGNVAGQWGVQGNVLYIAEGGGAPEGVAVRVKRNSNGYPIIVAEGAEYSMCR